MTMSEHADTEGLSAFLDGEAPELAAHLESCEACRQELAHLTAASRAVAAPVPPMEAEVVDAMIDRAVDARPGGTVTEMPPGRSRRGGGRWVAMASVAAMVLMAIGLVGVLTRGSGGNNAAADRASRSGTTSEVTGLQAPPGVAGTGDAAVSGELGEISDGSQLATKVAPALANRSALGGDNPVVSPPSAGGSGPVARAVGTRACELEARAIDPGVGLVVYVASATQDGAPATVLGFVPPTSSSPISLFLMARDGCRLLARATVP